jgi:hypothetical protein
MPLSLLEAILLLLIEIISSGGAHIHNLWTTIALCMKDWEREYA